MCVYSIYIYICIESHQKYISRQPVRSFDRRPPSPRSLVSLISLCLSPLVLLVFAIGGGFCGWNAQICSLFKEFLSTKSEVKPEMRPLPTPARTEKAVPPEPAKLPTPPSKKRRAPEVPEAAPSARRSRSSAYFDSPGQPSPATDTPTPHSRTSSVRPSPRPSCAPTTPAGSCQSLEATQRDTPTSKNASPPAAATSKPGPKPTDQPDKSGKTISDEEGDSDSERDISECALYHKLRRICLKKGSGKLLVPKEVHEAYKRGGDDRKALEKQLLGCGLDKAETSLFFIMTLDFLCLYTFTSFRISFTVCSALCSRRSSLPSCTSHMRK